MNSIQSFGRAGADQDSYVITSYSIHYTKLYEEQKKFSPDTVFRTRKLNLLFKPQLKPCIRAVLQENNIIILYNQENTDFNDDAVQEFIKKFILRCLKVEGTDFLLKRLNEISVKTGIKYKSGSVGTAGTRRNNFV